MAISPEGVENFILFEGGMSSSTYDDFLVKLIKEIMKKKNLRKVIFLHDNCRAHFGRYQKKTSEIVNYL